MVFSLKIIFWIWFYPKLDKHDEGVFYIKSKQSQSVRYAHLPRESGFTFIYSWFMLYLVCTENYTPWIKQLPCGKETGTLNS